MKIWLFSFGFLFGLVELYRWLKTLELPLPVYVVCGVALAIASNSERWMAKPVSGELSVPSNETLATPTTAIETENENSVSLPPPSISYKLEPPAWKKSSS